MQNIRLHLALAGLTVALLAMPAQGEVYLTPEKFLSESFSGSAPPPRVVWLTGALAEQAKTALGHKAGALRLRYWAKDGRSAWILDEIGKTEAITAGIVIENRKITQLRVLEFRESRGGEVRHPFFTDQFVGLSLREDTRLSDPVDGISGATLSVRAVENMARLALVLAQHVAATESPAP